MTAGLVPWFPGSRTLSFQGEEMHWNAFPVLNELCMQVLGVDIIEGVQFSGICTTCTFFKDTVNPR
jgi:hypothetical protein